MQYTKKIKDLIKNSNGDAPPGGIWVCGACGKTSLNWAGEHDADAGWDVSCSLNAVLCDKNSLIKNEKTGRVEEAKPLAGW